VLGEWNNVWKYEIEMFEVEDEDVMEYMDLNIILDASNSIQILGKTKGSNIQLTSKVVVIKGTVEN
jgi:hypothetical protein